MKNILLGFVILVFLISCQHTNSADTGIVKKGMIKVSILYPNGKGKTFDLDYYTNTHMPMLANVLGDSLKLYTIEKGIAGRTPDETVPYLAIGHLYFDKLSAYRNAFAPNAEKIVGDIPNYTNTQPIVQISEIIR